jgi:site-specific DNA-methyltransferase (adenine-specific)
VKPYFEDDAVRIYHGDCREILLTLPKLDLVLTDPPYGIGMESHGQLFALADKIYGDSSHKSYLWLDSLDLPLAAFFSPYSPPPLKWRSVLVWEKGSHVGIGGDRETCWKRDFELIGVKRNADLNGSRDSAVLHFPSPLPPPSGHVAEKPLSLLSYLIRKLTLERAMVLDPFMGSGTTLRAAKDLGRKAIGIEIEEKYCEIAAQRMAQQVLALTGTRES